MEQEYNYAFKGHCEKDPCPGCDECVHAWEMLPEEWPPYCVYCGESLIPFNEAGAVIPTAEKCTVRIQLRTKYVDTGYTFMEEERSDRRMN